MTENPPVEAETRELTDGEVAEARARCPLTLDAFPPNLRRSLDPASPAAVRMMAAKGLIVGSAREQLSALFFLSYDEDPKISDTARVTAGKANDKLHTGLRDDSLSPVVIDFYASALEGNDTYLEFIVLNQATSDETVARIAAVAEDRTVEVIAQNQLRLLRDERIVRALAQNPKVRVATRDKVLDFCVRSGLVLRDLPAYVEARKRILGEDPEVLRAVEAQEENTAEKLLADYDDKLRDDGERVEEKERLSFTQRVMQMTVSEKIKLATLGNKEARTILLRESNKLVALAAVSSPRITDGEVVSLTNSRTLHEDVMRYICSNREWIRNYQVKVNLVNNPKTPLAVSLKLLPHLHPSDLKVVARNKNIPSTLQTQAKGALMKKGAR